MLFWIIKNILIVVVLFGVLYAATSLSPQIKKQADTQISKVLGAKSDRKSDDSAIPGSLRKETKEGVDIIKEQAMHVDLSDVFQAVGRLQKIPQDAQNMLDDTKKTVEGYMKQK